MSSVLLDAQGVGRSFGARSVLGAVSVQVHDGERIGVVGRDGSGESTLLRILAGEAAADGGTVARRGSVAYLPQLVATPRLSAREAILERIGVAAAARELDRRAAALEGGDLDAIEAHAAALELSAAARRGDAGLVLEGAEVRRGGWRLGPLDLAVSYGDRLRLVGPNGAGKSTLLATLEGTLPLARGRRRVAPGAVVTILGQHRQPMAGERPAIAVLRAATGLDETAARTALAAFGLTAMAVERPASTLSPGERRAGAGRSPPRHLPAAR